MIYASSSAYSFGKQKKKTESSLIQKQMLQNPSFNNYNKQIINTPKKGYKFSRSDKFEKIRSKTPGPGTYDSNKLKSFGKGGPHFSQYMSDKQTHINKMLKKSIKIQTGPGKYNLTQENYNKTVGKSILSSHFGKSEKLKLNDNKVPGVGKYNLTCSTDFGKGNKGKYSITSSKRRSIVNNSKINSSARHKGDITALDPGKYNINPLFGKEGTHPAIRGKAKEPKRPKTPGPATYKFEEAKRKVLKKAPSALISSSKRSNIAKATKGPGPTKYNIKSTFDVDNKCRIKTYTFTKGERYPKKRDKTPGPAHYYLPCSFANTPAYAGIDNKYSKV